MSVEFVSSARGMSDFILKAAYQGPGDTLEAAMYRAERLYGAPAAWMHRLRYRSIKDMPVSAYAAIARAYRAAREASEKAYQAERELAHARHSKLLGMADALAGAPVSDGLAEITPVLVEASSAREGREVVPIPDRER